MISDNPEWMPDDHMPEESIFEIMDDIEEALDSRFTQEDTEARLKKILRAAQEEDEPGSQAPSQPQVPPLSPPADPDPSSMVASPDGLSMVVPEGQLTLLRTPCVFLKGLKEDALLEDRREPVWSTLERARALIEAAEEDARRIRAEAVEYAQHTQHTLQRAWELEARAQEKEQSAKERERKAERRLQQVTEELDRALDTVLEMIKFAEAKAEQIIEDARLKAMELYDPALLPPRSSADLCQAWLARHRQLASWRAVLGAELPDAEILSALRCSPKVSDKFHAPPTDDADVAALWGLAAALASIGSASASRTAYVLIALDNWDENTPPRKRFGRHARRLGHDDEHDALPRKVIAASSWFLSKDDSSGEVILGDLSTLEDEPFVLPRNELDEAVDQVRKNGRILGAHRPALKPGHSGAVMMLPPVSPIDRTDE